MPSAALADLKAELKNQLLYALRTVPSPNGTSAAAQETRPHVIFVVGVNGTGKTTTIGKLAHRLRQSGKNVVLAAGDTFRAAAIEQLGVWATRTGSEIVKTKSGGDPAAVVYDALTSARARNADVVIVDTAGRLHTKLNLMAELDKMKRTAAKIIPGAPHEVLLVMDATTGQNGLSQAREFTATAGVTGIVLTKLDGTAKGGIVVAITRELGPARAIRRHRRIDGRSGARLTRRHLSLRCSIEARRHRFKWHRLQPVGVGPCQDQTPQAEACATENRRH